MPTILLINPNSSTKVTSAILRSAEEALCSDEINSSTPIRLQPFQAPSHAPPSIDDAETSDLSAAACLPVLEPYLSDTANVDAFLVACYSDHPLVQMLREKTAKPVMGILEASAIYALEKGQTFGVVTTGGQWIEPLTKANEAILRQFDSHALDRFVGVAASGLGVLEFHPEASEVMTQEILEKQRDQRIGTAARELVEKVGGVDTVVLGCAGMEGMGDAILKGIALIEDGDDENVVQSKLAMVKVSIVDGVTAGTILLARKIMGA